MKILVLGAAGPTGRSFVDQARAGGHEVTGERLTLSGFPKVARADVAHCMLRALDGAEWIGKRVVVPD